jgi:hypothetical protein
MVNRVFLDAEGILNIWVVGDQTDETVREMGEKLKFYRDELVHGGRPVLVLDNLLRMGNTTSGARREVARIARTLHFERAAMVGGGSPAMRYGTNLMLRAIGRRNLRYFASHEAARRWLLGLSQPKTPRS